MNELRFQVRDYLETMSQHFEKFDALTQALAKTEFSTSAFNQLMEQVRVQSVVIHEYQTEHQLSYDAYLKSGQPLSSSERELVQSLEAKLKNLIGQYGEFESEARDARTKLLPVVNENIRSVRMKSAYGRHTG